MSFDLNITPLTVREVSQRTVYKRFRCPVCNKSSEKEIVGGELTFLSGERCLFTKGCMGIPVYDPNGDSGGFDRTTAVDVNPRVIKHKFVNQRFVRIPVNKYRKILTGEVVYDVFVEAFDSDRNRVLVKQYDFVVVEKTDSEIVIDIGLIRNGVVVATDMQQHTETPILQPGYSVEKTIPTTILNSNGTLTVALEDNIDTRYVSKMLPFRVKQYGQGVEQLVEIQVYNHIVDSRGRTVDNVFNSSRTVCIHGKIYVLYSGVVSPTYYRRGIAIDFGGIDGWIVLARADKTSETDIIRDYAVKLDLVTFGTIYGDGLQWVVGDTRSSVIVPVAPPMLVV